MEFVEKCRMLDALLGVGRSFDMVGRDLCVGGRRGRLWVVNGYAEDALLERAVERLQAAPPLEQRSTPEELVERYVTVCDASVCRDKMQAVTAVFSGKTLLVVDGFPGGILMDAKQLPTRSVQEPDAGKVLRGSHDGFVESIMKNAALLRRRIRDPALTLERVQTGGRSRCDVALCYMKGQADEALLERLRRKLEQMQVRSVSLGQETVAEAIAPRQWWNPFPKVRFTERPDVATAAVMEGDILLLVDNTPAVMLLPVSLFRFAEEINDYYFPPLVGTYLRMIRVVVLTLNVIITPLWYLLVTDEAGLSGGWEFLLIEGEYAVPILLQLLLVELIIDVLKLASLNTPDVLGNSFSMLGALILGDFAVQSRWLVPEVLVYMAFVAVSNFAQHSFEMGYACKLCRMGLLVLCGLLRWWGFGLGLAGILVLLATARPIGGGGYLYPLIPFDGRAMRALLLRHPVNRNNT